MITFAKFTKEERRAVEIIIDRARGVLAGTPFDCDRLEIQMDLSAVHAHTPLRLDELAQANVFEFTHDIAGIRRHLDRKTGELRDCFVPRFAARESELTGPRETIEA